MAPNCLQIFTLILTCLTFILLTTGLYSAMWIKKSVNGQTISREGLYETCVLDGCSKIGPLTSVHRVSQIFGHLMIVIYVINLAGQCAAVFLSYLRFTRIFALIYFSTAIIAFSLLVIYPTNIRPIGKDGQQELWFDWGFYVFLSATLLLVGLSVQCYELDEDTFPGIELRRDSS
ncbi:uncharacterized protein LOC131942119 isoform X2 [Physella acuta]|uniref:uncharacterized protein LOC131942119 isoform X2 n=1 Tax=Physella acuta TaxID=109671 RepID=UPI0027DB2742|nr:uncharacterized protein LOC131942119 isoform X2 [Physella acuta]